MGGRGEAVTVTGQQGSGVTCVTFPRRSPPGVCCVSTSIKRVFFLLPRSTNINRNNTAACLSVRCEMEDNIQECFTHINVLFHSPRSCG